MSGADDHFLARWSRRKRAVEASEGPEPDAPADAAPGLAAEEPNAGQLRDGADQQPLPRIEDLTAESDLSAFLRKGVPDALKKAALRRMWSLDPAIRDFIGPAEYTWDFNTPGGVPGFGPAPEGVQALVSSILGATAPERQEPTPPAAGEAAVPPSQDAADQQDAISQEAPAVSDLPVNAAAEIPAISPSADKNQEPRPGSRRHGGAAPRSRET